MRRQSRILAAIGEEGEEPEKWRRPPLARELAGRGWRVNVGSEVTQIPLSLVAWSLYKPNSSFVFFFSLKKTMMRIDNPTNFKEVMKSYN